MISNDNHQSAYRKEIALLKVQIDFSEPLEEGSMSSLIMLNLSATFDVIDFPALRSFL